METSVNEAPDDNSDDAARTRRRRLKLFGIVFGIAAAVGGVYWLVTRNHETTDDAFIEADVVRVAPQVGGPVLKLAFGDNQRVGKGAVLLEIDPRDYQVALAQAKASLGLAQAGYQAAQADFELTRLTTIAAVDQARNGVEQTRHQMDEARQQVEAAQAEAERAGSDAKRYQGMLEAAAASRQRYEQATADARGASARWRASKAAVTAAQAQMAQAQARLADAMAAPQRLAQKQAMLDNAKAAVEQAEAAVQGAELNLSYTRLIAPQSGRIAKRAINVGDVVQRGQILANLVVDPPWVIANYKETQLKKMRPGQTVSLTVDAFPDHAFTGHVDSIQPGSGSRFSLLPAENATGNYVKVVQRVPVKIVFDKPDDPKVGLLAPGMSVTPDVDVASDPETR